MQKGYLAILLCMLAGCTGSEMPKDMQYTIRNAAFQRNIASVNIAVVAPGSGVSNDKLSVLRKSLPKNVGLAKSYPNNMIFHSDTDEHRAAELLHALENPDIDVIWSLRGGYGSARLLPVLQSMEKPTKKKLFVGYSDNTFLHLYLNRWGWQTIHGPALTEFFTSKEGENFKRMAKVLSGKTPVLQYTGLRPLNAAARSQRTISGPILGGNLSIVTNSIGTDWQIRAQDHILFLEDVHSKGHAVDRDLIHLKQAGLLKNVKAILLGEFLYGDEAVQYALERFAASESLPVFQSNLFGHGAKNYPLPFGCKSQIYKTQGQKGYSLTVETPRI